MAVDAVLQFISVRKTIDATIMIIEHAERFGLAQLHQLRGRIGRGSKKSVCILLYDQKIGEIARERLTVMRETNNGFIISEKDLKLRGAGEILGTKQSGGQMFKVLDINYHENLIKIANKQAKLIINNNPNLIGEEGEKLKSLLKRDLWLDSAECLELGLVDRVE